MDETTIETSGTEVSEPAATEPATESATAKTDPAPAGVAVPAEAAPVPKAETRPEPDKEVLEATVAMGKAAAASKDEALKAADAMARELLLKTIAFQLPLDWIDEETNGRIQRIETEGLALILSWLALNWWAGYAVGQGDTVNALKVAAERKLLSADEQAAMPEVEKAIAEAAKVQP